jgi:hypothetical protein
MKGYLQGTHDGVTAASGSTGSELDAGVFQPACSAVLYFGSSLARGIPVVPAAKHRGSETSSQGGKHQP